MSQVITIMLTFLAILAIVISIISQLITLLPYIALFVFGEYFICNKYPRYEKVLPIIGLIYFILLSSLFILFPAVVSIKSNVSIFTLLQTAGGQSYALFLFRLSLHSLPAIGSYLMMRYYKKQNAHQ